MNISSRLWLLYLWRLEKEKGFWLFLEVIKSYQWSDLPFDVYIFWDGSYHDELLELQSRYQNIHFFWWKTLQEVERYLENIDYCIMPSLCIETFGLSALNVLQWGIPVVWFQKGGLQPFILDDYAINQVKGKTQLAQFKVMINKLIEEKKNQNPDFYQELSKKCKTIAWKYTQEKWFEQFQSMVFDFKCRKIVLVSDFINTIGGIESYLHTVKELLETKGYHVLLWGSECPSWFWGKVKRLWGLWLAVFNCWDALRFHFFIKRENPDLIWYNSMIRWNGWVPVRATRAHRAKKWMMYHDLGYFHPFPSRVYELDQIRSLTRLHYLEMTQSKNIFVFLCASWKYLSLKLLWIQLKKQISKHLIPSPFIRPYLRAAFDIQINAIETFAHFIQK